LVHLTLQIESNGIISFQNQLSAEDANGVNIAGGGGGMHLGFVAGVIPRERLTGFEKMLWRACRGNVFLRQADIEEPIADPMQSGEEIRLIQGSPLL
jgi:hypothetical protein